MVLRHQGSHGLDPSVVRSLCYRLRAFSVVEGTDHAVVLSGRDRVVGQKAALSATTQVGVVQPRLNSYSVTVRNRYVPLTNRPRCVSSGVW